MVQREYREDGGNRERNLVETVTDKINQTSQRFFRFTCAEIAQLRNAVYDEIVQKCGKKTYWEECAKFVAEYALYYQERIGKLIGQYEEYELKLKRFRTDLETDLTTEISDDEVIEMKHCSRTKANPVIIAVKIFRMHRCKNSVNTTKTT